MKESESIFGKGFYEYDKHLEFFTKQGQQGAEAAFYALALSELLIVEPEWARAMSMRLKDTIEVLNRAAYQIGWESNASLNDYLMKKIPLPPEITKGKPDYVAIAKRDLAIELRKLQGKEVFLAYHSLKEEFQLKYREYQQSGRVSSEEEITDEILALLRCEHKSERNQYIKRHQDTFLSKLSNK